ncbi:MAG: amidohydrolase family protein [Cyclobacteriaceae bacterium]
MKNKYLLILACLFASCSVDQSEQEEMVHFDYLISDVSIIDGSGRPAYNGHVGVRDGKIAYVGEERPEKFEADSVFSINGAVVSPGFIDLHSHGNPERTPEFENFLAMGVTTICLGQDGSGFTFTSPGEWNEFAQGPTGVNVIAFAGHGTLRELAGIGRKPVPDAAEMDSMKNILRTQLEWAFGLSTGLEYSPGMYAERDELLELAKVTGSLDRVIMSHMRNEDDDQVIASIDELAAQGTYSRVHIAHLKSVYGKGSERGEEILQHIRSIRNSGVDLTADIYPYTASYTGISIVFPEWAKTREQFEQVKDARRAELEDYLRERVNSRNGPSATLFGTKPYAGKTLADLQEEWDMPFEDILIDSIGPQGASAAYFVMNEELQETLISDSLIAICSDGSPTGYHPRGHGTHARIIEEFVKNRNVLELPEAIRKMTSYPAQILKLTDRGLIKEGYAADLLVFRPDQVKANATFEDPFQLASGFILVMVNGEVARRNAGSGVKLNGKFLTPSE